MAIVLLLLIMLTFGAMEYGWMFFKMQQVTNAARAGAREAVLPDASNSTVQSSIDFAMNGWGMGAIGYIVDIYSGPSGSIDGAGGGQLITVTVDVPYPEIEVLGMPLFPTPATLRGRVTMAKEGP